MSRTSHNNRPKVGNALEMGFSRLTTSVRNSDHRSVGIPSAFPLPDARPHETGRNLRGRRGTVEAVDRSSVHGYARWPRPSRLAAAAAGLALVADSSCGVTEAVHRSWCGSRRRGRAADGERLLGCWAGCPTGPGGLAVGWRNSDVVGDLRIRAEMWAQDCDASPEPSAAKGIRVLSRLASLTLAGRRVQKLVHAACRWYSWSRPLSRSRRSTRRWLSLMTTGSVRASGDSSWSARWGRWPL
jgi:hypothetical protein